MQDIYIHYCVSNMKDGLRPTQPPIHCVLGMK